MQVKNKTPLIKTHRLIEGIGWIGVLCIVIAYITVTLEVIEPSSFTYGLLNIFGSLGILLSSYAKRDFQPILLNTIWIVVAIIGIVVNIAT